jgi:hypothetical protein
MDQSEFDGRFLKAARTSWPSFGKWLDKQDSPADTRGLWCRTMRDVDIDLALEIIRDMFAGDVPIPGGDRYTKWELLPSAVRREAQRRTESHGTYESGSPRVSDGEVTYKCRYCCDNGWVVVATRAMVAAAMVGRMREYAADPLKPNGVAVPCCCERGLSSAEKSKRTPYKPDSHWMIAEALHDRYIAELEAKAAQAIEWTP